MLGLGYSAKSNWKGFSVNNILLKKRSPYLKQVVAAQLVVASLTSTSVYAEGHHHNHYAMQNMLGTALLTVVTGYFKGDIHSWRDVSRYALSGAISGYGFYQAKEWIGQGDEDKGVALGYLSASLLENTTLGEHPLGFVRYGAGPIEFRLATPFAKNKRAWLTLDIDAVETAYAIKNLYGSDSVGFRYGAMYGITDQEINNGSTRTRARGVALGRSIKLHEDYAYLGSSTWRHEAIHGIQALQFSSLIDAGRHYSYETLDTKQDDTRLFSVGLRGDLVYGAFTVGQSLVNYRDQWSEREAFGMTEPL